MNFFLIFIPEAFFLITMLLELKLKHVRFRHNPPLHILSTIFLIFLLYFVALTLVLFYQDESQVSGAEVLAYSILCIQWIIFMNTYQVSFRHKTWLNTCLISVKVYLVFELFHSILITYIFSANYDTEGGVLRWISFLPWMLYYLLFIFIILNRYIGRKEKYSRQHTQIPQSLIEEPQKDIKNASLFSKIFLWWVYPMLKLGRRKVLDEEDIKRLRNKETCVYQTNQFLRYLEKYLVPPYGKNSLFGAVLHRFRNEVLITSTFAITAAIMDFSGPVFILLIESFISGEGAYWKGFALVGYMMICKLVQAICNAQSRFLTQLIGAHIKTTLSSYIYSKSLKASNLNSSSQSNSKFSYAQIVNLMQVDLERISLNITTSMRAVVWPFQLGIGIFLLYYTIGFAGATAGLILMVVLFCINIVLSKHMSTIQKLVMAKKDIRMKYCNELLNCMKVLKLYNWETKLGERVNQSRDVEMKYQSKYLYFLMITIFLNWGTRNYLAIAIVVTMAVAGNTLTPGDVFAGLAVIGILNMSLRLIPDIINNVLQMMISMKRIQDFLVAPEIVSYNSKEKAHLKPYASVVIKDTSFSYERQLNNQQQIQLALQNLNLEINKGELVAVVGRVASGKSTLLQALINNMTMIKESDSSYMVVSGSVSYVSQESWIQNTTIKNNILFGSDFDENKYHEVIEVSALRPDLDILPGGDLTEIGEKGINLSGGQKSRVSIARAAYADTDIVLLDDPLSAVDAHVGREIFNKCIRRYMSGKTRILVTNGQQFLPYVDRIIVMDKGQIVEQGTYQELTGDDSFFIRHIQVSLKVDIQDQQKDESERSTIEAKEIKLDLKPTVVSEDRAVGKISWEVYKTYIKYSGGWLIALIAIFFMFCWMADRIYADIFLSSWTDASADEQNDRKAYFITLFTVLSFSVNLFILARLLVTTSSGIKAARTLFTKQIAALLDAPVNKFYDITPSGRILNRLSKDQSMIDGQIILSSNAFIGQIFTVLSVIIVAAYVVPYVLIIVPVAMYLSFKIQRFYLSSSRELMRIESISRSPIVQHFSETISGAETIRAFNYQMRFLERNVNLVDKNISFYFDLQATNAWLSISLELVSNMILFTSCLVIVATRGSISTGLIGLALSYAVSLPDNIYWLIYLSAVLETTMVSVERTHALALTSPEAPRKSDKDTILYQAGWPSEGAIKFENYQMKYRDDTEMVLRGVDATIFPGEKIGIVGRTGSGKSSLCLSLFRIVEPYSGKIFIDGVDVTEIGLDILRQKLCVIPQDPVLFKGTVRYNLDPFEENADGEMIEILRILFPEEDPEQLLDKEVQEGGSNFSVGQKQLICIARAIIRKSKIMFLDEATASVDYKTDELIQNTIRERFQGRTVLTIAHRINTILDYDRVLVMDNGRVAEFDTPKNLLKQQGIFYSLVSQQKL